MKKYDKQTKKFINYVEDNAEELLMQKLDLKKIPYIYSSKGLFINDEDVLNAEKEV